MSGVTLSIYIVIKTANRTYIGNNCTNRKKVRPLARICTFFRCTNFRPLFISQRKRKLRIQGIHLKQNLRSRFSLQISLHSFPSNLFGSILSKAVSLIQCYDHSLITKSKMEQIPYQTLNKIIVL